METEIETIDSTAKINRKGADFGKWLADWVPGQKLATFRLVFGLMMAFGTGRFWILGWIEDHYINPILHFKYPGFEWIEVAPAFWMYIIHALMFLASLGIAFNLAYRWSAVVFFITFTYTELIDITYYLNHYYFVSLAGLLLCFLPSPQPFPEGKIRRWAILLIQFQIFIVYFHAGIAKINSDWMLHALPLKIWLPAHDKLPLIGPLLRLPETAFAFSWIGMFFDATVILFMLYRQTRPWAYLAILIFHTLTGLMFQIGIFPLVMIAATTVFFSDNWHGKLWKKLYDLKYITFKYFKIFNSKFPPLKRNIQHSTVEGGQQPNKILMTLVVVYALFQILLPWRYLLFPGSLFWTENGFRFSWRVMLMEKAGTATFFVRDKNTGREGEVMNTEFLNSHQEKQMAFQPDLILQYANFLKNYYQSRGIHDPQVRAEVYVTLNGRPSQLYFDPQLDLTSVRDNLWDTRAWLYPLSQ